MVLPEPGSQRHLAVGNINIDLSLAVPRLPGRDEIVYSEDAWISPGGAASNYAVAVASLGQRSYLRAVAGREAKALGVLEELSSRGVDVSLVDLVDEPSGFVVVLVERGESARAMVKVRGANRLLTLEERHLEAFGGGHIHLASVDPRLVVEARRLCPECTISYDPGGEALARPDGVLEAVPRADWILINTIELRGLTGSSDPLSALRLIEAGGRLVVVKHGRGGATAVTSGSCIRVSRLPDVRVVDVTGAGDSFDAAFNIWLLAGAPLGEALRYAAAAGSAKVAKRGSSTMPSLGEVLEAYRGVGGVEEC